MKWRAPCDTDPEQMIANHRSQAGQDLFVIAMTQGKRSGTWLEIGCCSPDYHNNTWLLEKHLAWSGISIDIIPSAWEQMRPGARFIVDDALAIDYAAFDPSFDYLQVDVATPLQNLQVLSRVLETQRFSVITYEHDAYSCGDGIQSRIQSRGLLHASGYDLIVSDVWCPKDTHAGRSDQDTYFEDWWADPTKIAPYIRDAYRHLGQDNQPKYFMELLFQS